MDIQLGQLRLNPPGLGSKCGKRVERLSDFGEYKGNFTHSILTYLNHYNYLVDFSECFVVKSLIL